MIDISIEHTIPLTKAAQLVPGRPHVSTLWRWSNRGVRGHKLETVVIGGRRYTSKEALQRFFAGQNGPQPSQGSCPNHRRELELQHVEQQLVVMGID